VSLPAQRVGSPRPAATPPPARDRPTSRPAALPAARPPTAVPSRPGRRARRASRPAFWVFAAIVVTTLVLGVVSLSAMLVQSGFRVDEVQGRIADLQDRSLSLTHEVAELSSPARIAAWARSHGLVVPDDVVVLRVSAEGELPG
jgi:cell division protein FtsL